MVLLFLLVREPNLGPLADKNRAKKLGFYPFYPYFLVFIKSDLLFELNQIFIRNFFYPVFYLIYFLNFVPAEFSRK